MKRHWGLLILRFVLGLVVGAYSLALVLQQLHHRLHLWLFVLGAAELVAAILFLLPKTVRLGGIALIVVFAVAAGIHLLHGDRDVAYLAVFAAAALAVVSPEKRA